MASSFEKINYSLRANKSIERKMICEALGRLNFIEHLENYRYIGFGSAYFADFTLIHKSLGITDLLSIELDEDKKERFEFNIPYAGIVMKYGHSSTILPNLQLDLKKNILWLDYDDKISDYMFNDIDTFFFNAMPGSFFILSVNVEQDFMTMDSYDPENKITISEFRMNELLTRISKSRLPIEYTNVNMNTKNLSKASYDMITRQIATSLNNRNGMSEDKISFKQLLNFSYKDGAAILTIGGLLYNKTQKSKIKNMEFGNLPFIQTGLDSYKIQSPNLTIREVKALDRALPDPLEFDKGKFKSEQLQMIPLIPSDKTNYAKIYRYYPNYSETNL